MADKIGPIGRIPIRGRLRILKNSLTSVPLEINEEYRYRDIFYFSRYLIPLKWAILSALFLTFICSILNTLLPLSSKWIIDYIFMKQSTEPLFDFISKVHFAFLVPFLSPVLTSLPLLITMLALVQVVKYFLNNELSLINYRINTEYGFRVKMAVFSRVMKYPVSYFRSTRSGYLLGRIQEDTGGLSSISGSVLHDFTTAGTTLLVSATVLMTLSFPLTAAVILSVPFSVALSYYIIRFNRSYNYRVRETSLNLSAESQDLISTIDLIKVHAAEERELSRFKKSSLDAISLQITSMLYSQVTGGLQRVVISATRLVVMLIGGGLVLCKDMSIGDYTAFLAMYPQMTGSISSLLKIPLSLQCSAISAGRVKELLDLPTEYEHEDPEKTLFTPDHQARGDIRCSGLCFGYEDGSRVLSDISLQISQGECVAFCGPTGAGKTTFIHLLLRFFRPQRGTITLDNYDLRDLSPAWVREQIAVVSQDLMLFHDTIMNNIRYSRPDATEEMVINAARQAGIHDEVRNFPAGYNTLVGERGGKLSGGQKQRIAIARALIRNSPIIILDEPTAHLDFETEERLLIEFMRICQGRTMIVITHRPGLLHLAQRIYEVKDGRIIEKLKKL
jgi:subfamily B ATP-binding cassette protein MsbA